MGTPVAINSNTYNMKTPLSNMFDVKQADIEGTNSQSKLDESSRKRMGLSAFSNTSPKVL